MKRGHWTYASCLFTCPNIFCNPKCLNFKHEWDLKSFHPWFGNMRQAKPLAISWRIELLFMVSSCNSHLCFQKSFQPMFPFSFLWNFFTLQWQIIFKFGIFNLKIITKTLNFFPNFWNHKIERKIKNHVSHKVLIYFPRILGNLD